MIEEKQIGKLKYLLSYPEDFDSTKKYSLVVFLHGAGTRGQTTEILRKNGCFGHLVKRQTKGYVLLAPLCSDDNWTALIGDIIELVDMVRHYDYIDIKRVYLTGNSMGGYGTWELGALRSDWFAALMPVCGGGIFWMTYKLIDVPVRTFHGLCDNVVPPTESIRMVEALNKQGGYAELTLYPKLEHNCWDLVYTTEENYDWLFKFTTDRDKTKLPDFSGEYYG